MALGTTGVVEFTAVPILPFYADNGAWGFQPHPEISIGLMALAGGYVLAVTKLSPRYAPAGEKPATTRQLVLFLLGVVAMWSVLEGPVHTVAEGYWYNFHMLQHMVLTLAAPPLLLLGTPAWLMRLLLRPVLVKRVFARLVRPVPALVMFNAVLMLTHLPPAVELTMTHEFVHAALHSALIGTAIIAWWPIFSPLPELPAISYPAQMLYLFVQSIAPTIPASFLTLGDTPLYSFYEQAPRLAGLDAVTDQQLGGLLMKLVGGLFLWVLIAIVFFKWYAKDEAENPYALKWPEIERELGDMGLTKR